MPLSPAIDGVTKALASDDQILSYKGLTTSSPLADLAAYIRETEQTEGIVTAETIPLILIYTRPGKPDRSTIQQYISKVVIDVFAKDSYTARSISDRVFDVLHNADLPSPTFQISTCRYAHDSDFVTGISGVEGHRSWFDVSFYIG